MCMVLDICVDISLFSSSCSDLKSGAVVTGVAPQRSQSFIGLWRARRFPHRAFDGIINCEHG
jgi:hypothetical protein